jgi:hypothetical protein
MNNALAVGNYWIKGAVTKSPWTEKYTYIQLDNVQYTIMKDTPAVSVYTRNGITSKDIIKISSIQRGDTLLINIEGNRIYQIEKLR